MKFPLTGQEKVLIKSNSDKFYLCRQIVPLSGNAFIDEGGEIYIITEHFSSTPVFLSVVYEKTFLQKASALLLCPSRQSIIVYPIQGHHHTTTVADTEPVNIQLQNCVSSHQSTCCLIYFTHMENSNLAKQKV